MCVPVWACSAACRRSRSTAACTRESAADFALADDCLVHAQALDGALDVQDLDDEAVTGDEAGVGGLAAGFGVERGLGQDELDFVARGGLGDLAAAG